MLTGGPPSASALAPDGEDGAYLWDANIRSRVTRSIERARAGQPTLLVVNGEAGVGKTALLDKVVALARGFQVRYAEGWDTADRQPFRVLAQWGVEIRSEDAGGRIEPLVAAQKIREWLGETPAGGPVMLRLDDLQWADEESSEALTWLLRRSTVDPLLVVVGSRPLERTDHPGWQRWLAGPAQYTEVTLSGLTEVAAEQLIRSTRPGLSHSAAQRLWAHTDGNPMYLTALLAEFEDAELNGRRDLPAPAGFAELLAARLARRTQPERHLLRALAVLGPSWSWLNDAAAVGEVSGAVGVAGGLARAGLVQLRTVDVGRSARIATPMIRAAVYQESPFEQRRDLHLRAARNSADPMEILEHRIAAADGYDDALAGELVDRSSKLHDVGSYRLSARFLRSAGTLTSDPGLRERRWLESLFDSLLGQDVAAAHTEMRYIEQAADVARRRLVLGLLATVEGRWPDAVRILDDASGDGPAPSDPQIEYRRCVLLGWGLVGAGRSTEEIQAGLDRGDALHPKDIALAAYERNVRSYARQRQRGIDGTLSCLTDVPEVASDTPNRITFALAMRGGVRMRLGQFGLALDDLTEVRRRFEGGLIDVADGLYTARLGQYYWFTGDWARARANFRIALDASERFVQPMVGAMISYQHSGAGDLDRTDDVLSVIRAFLAQRPWPEARRSLMVADVIRLHAAGSSAEQNAYLGSISGLVAFLRTMPTAHGAVEMMHLVQAMIWGGDLDQARWAVGLLRAQTPPPDFGGAVAAWLDALIAEAAGDLSRSVTGLRHALGDPSSSVMPFYRAHMLIDHARVSARTARDVDSRRSRAEALSIYAGLGAQGYLDRESQIDSTATVPIAAPAYGLSEREKEVLRLIVLGFSYAQVSRDLFISRSTVGFHLSNIYAKTDVSTRHELTALVRAEPAAFGALALGA